MLEYVHVDTTDPLEAYERGLGESTPEGLPAPTAKEQDIADRLAGLMLDWSARDVALSTCDLVVLTAWRHAGWEVAVSSVAWTLWYAEWLISKHSYFKGRKPMDDINALVTLWHTTLIAMSTAHTHEAFTGAEHSTDDLLRPLLKAPIAQIREFAAKLAAALEGDPAVPFLVWSSYKNVVMPLILKRPEGKPAELKEALAKEVAELVAESIPREDWVASIAGALQWRATDQLVKTREAVKAGAAPRVKGRQSCLFLTTHAADGRELSTVIL